MRFWFKKKEFNIDDVVPVTVAEVAVYRKKIQTLLDPYISDDEKNNKKIFRKFASKVGGYQLSIEKFFYGADVSYPIMAKLVKKLKEAGIWNT